MHRSPRSRDAESSTNETFGLLAGMCLSYMHLHFESGDSRLKSVKLLFLSPFRDAQGGVSAYSVVEPT